jgi:hypothetical protein
MSVTVAFFQSLRFPIIFPRRLNFTLDIHGPHRFDFTLKIFSTAFPISTRLAADQPQTSPGCLFLLEIAFFRINRSF